ncbi:hypothetical protein [Sphingomonas sp. 3-13AW]|uniref:hypothetical protein n=1 Tax=Sphingomonas sp. 3-13AW TaxID=3050450 RepID=UPI003BB6EC9A
MDRVGIISFVTGEVVKISGLSHPVTEGFPLADLPLDSLQCLELTALVEDRYDVQISCCERTTISTIGDFADLVILAVAG